MAGGRSPRGAALDVIGVSDISVMTQERGPPPNKGNVGQQMHFLCSRSAYSAFFDTSLRIVSRTPNTCAQDTNHCTLARFEINN